MPNLPAIEATLPKLSVTLPPPAPNLDTRGQETEQLNRAADQAVNDALSVFGVSRRTPGAQLPATDLVASISGSMRLGSLDDESTTRTPPSHASPVGVLDDATDDLTDDFTDLGDEEQVRSDLSGFQNGTNRAERELRGSDT